MSLTGQRSPPAAPVDLPRPMTASNATPGNKDDSYRTSRMIELLQLVRDSLRHAFCWLLYNPSLQIFFRRTLMG